MHILSDAHNSETDEQHKDRESQDLSASPSYGMSHPGLALPMMHYVASSQLGLGNAQTAYPYPDPYYRGIFAPCETQPYPSQPYAPQPMVNLQLMGIQQAGLPLPSDSVEEPVFVNAKQYHGILRRRQSRAKAGSEHKFAKARKRPKDKNARPFHGTLQFSDASGQSVQLSSHQEEDTITILPSNILVVMVENLLNVFEIRDKGTQRQKQPPYLHESRHLHALKRARGMGGQFQKKNENQQRDVESSDKSQAHFNQNCDNDDPGSSESAS
ncbi:UNVERIFIED_CONTAM: Nuclear transcription factor Y subunit A-7 [Sesamum latifolium]|uniref:Nuclear transcription factor Y subunit n=1 Tax=Sesamum latifolium TaxID=2727402 RepID=A0AAW2TVB5_9LAMI